MTYGSISSAPGSPPRLCVRAGEDAVELAGLDLGVDPALVDAPNLDRLLAAPSETWEALDEAVAAALDDAPRFPLAGARASMPFTVGDYVDFYTSLEHATNLGRLFRPDAPDPLTPNWRHLPIGYHGRAGTVVVSGTSIARPHGQLRAGVFGATEQLDIELELGFVAGGPPNALGEPIPIERAGARIFGYVLVNDWSARDIQRWEYVPLGPFLGKSFATSISAWVVRAPEIPRVPGRRQDPEPLPYLRQPEPRALDVALEIEINGETISRTNASGLYWSPEQQLAHAAVNGAVVRPGDLFASGTISGADPDSEGSLIELRREFLRDGDTVVLRGRAGDVALGDVAGTVR